MKKHKKKNKRERAYEKVLAPGEIIPLWRDMMFCQIFGDKNYEFALNYLLATLLELDVNDIKGHLTYLVKDLKNYNKRQMLNKVDLLLELNDEIINIEVNTDDIMLKRNIVYLGKLLATTLKRGAKSYDEITKVVQINFDHFKTDKKRLLATSMIRDEDGLVDVDNFVIYNISMELAKDKCYNLVENFKFNNKAISIDHIKESFINKNKKFNNDYAYMILDADQVPMKCIPVPCKICSLS